jgi:(p)ppGpp synthase/HD superfamily hydrolase
MTKFAPLSQLLEATNRAGFEKAIGPFFLPSECWQIMAAYSLSKYGHRDQVREAGGRYFEHPKVLALLLVRLGVRNADVICAALLHDVIEDTFILQPEHLERWFGGGVCHIVTYVTKDPLNGLTKEQYFARITGDDFRTWLVKLADRLHNMSTLADCDEPVEKERLRRKKLDQVAETRTYILPLAHLLVKVPGYDAIGQFFIDELTALCNSREAEATVA